MLPLSSGARSRNSSGSNAGKRNVQTPSITLPSSRLLRSRTNIEFRNENGHRAKYEHVCDKESWQGDRRLIYLHILLNSLPIEKQRPKNITRKSFE